MADDQIQQVKDRIDIVELINQYVPLKRAGANHKGLCPFHKERSPSFMANAERQIYKCFGCGESGDVISFIQKMEGLSFPEALELLADRAGIKLDRRKAPEQYAKEKDEKTVLFRINAATAKFFHHLLANHPSGQAARDYLASRTVSAETMSAFQLGFAPSQPVLGPWLQKHGFTGAQLRGAGSPDRFRARVMFPIRDTLGNVVGFTGRLLPGDESGPKYFNTPETPIFRKGQLVYGLFEGKNELRTERTAVLVEGQMDVVLSHQVGLKTAVASSGTAITLDHLKALRRYVDKLLIAFDADDAGKNATKKTIALAFDAELAPRVVVMPDGCKDAGEVIAKDPVLWVEAVKAAVPAIDWLVDTEIEQQPKPLDGAGKKAIAKAVLQLIARVADPVERAHYLGILAARLHIPEQSLIDAYERATGKQRQRATASTEQSANTAPQPARRRWSLAEQLAGLVLLRPSLSSELELTDVLFPPQSLAYRLFNAVSSWYNAPDRPEGTDAFAQVKSQFSESEQHQLSLLVAELADLVAEHEPREIAEEFLVRLRREQNESIKQSIADEIRAAEGRGDRQAVKDLITKLQATLKG